MQTHMKVALEIACSGGRVDGLPVCSVNESLPSTIQKNTADDGNVGTIRYTFTSAYSVIQSSCAVWSRK